MIKDIDLTVRKLIAPITCALYIYIYIERERERERKRELYPNKAFRPMRNSQDKGPTC